MPNQNIQDAKPFMGKRPIDYPPMHVRPPIQGRQRRASFSPDKNFMMDTSESLYDQTRRVNNSSTLPMNSGLVSRTQSDTNSARVPGSRKITIIPNMANVWPPISDDSLIREPTNQTINAPIRPNLVIPNPGRLKVLNGSDQVEGSLSTKVTDPNVGQNRRSTDERTDQNTLFNRQNYIQNGPKNEETFFRNNISNSRPWNDRSSETVFLSRQVKVHPWQDQPDSKVPVEHFIIPTIQITPPFEETPRKATFPIKHQADAPRQIGGVLKSVVIADESGADSKASLPITSEESDLDRLHFPDGRMIDPFKYKFRERLIIIFRIWSFLSFTLAAILLYKSHYDDYNIRLAKYLADNQTYTADFLARNSTWNQTLSKFNLDMNYYRQVTKANLALSADYQQALVQYNKDIMMFNESKSAAEIAYQNAMVDYQARILQYQRDVAAIKKAYEDDVALYHLEMVSYNQTVSNHQDNGNFTSLFSSSDPGSQGFRIPSGYILFYFLGDRPLVSNTLSVASCFIRSTNTTLSCSIQQDYSSSPFKVRVDLPSQNRLPSSASCLSIVARADPSKSYQNTYAQVYLDDVPRYLRSQKGSIILHYQETEVYDSNHVYQKSLFSPSFLESGDLAMTDYHPSLENLGEMQTADSNSIVIEFCPVSQTISRAQNSYPTLPQAPYLELPFTLYPPLNPWLP